MTRIWPGLTPLLKIFEKLINFLKYLSWILNFPIPQKVKTPFLTPNKVQTIINNPLTCPQRCNFVNSPSPFIRQPLPTLYSRHSLTMEFIIVPTVDLEYFFATLVSWLFREVIPKNWVKYQLHSHMIFTRNPSQARLDKISKIYFSW